MITTFALSPKVADALEVPLAQLCAAAAIDPEGPWSTADFFKLWTAAEACIDDSSAGLRFGARGIAGGYGVAALVALHAPTLREALSSIARYKRLTCPEAVEVERVGDEAWVYYRWLQADGPVPCLLTDMTLASLRQLVREGTGDKVVPRRLELMRRPGDEARLVQHFGCPIRFEAPCDAMVFDAAALDARFVTADAPAFERILSGLESALRSADIDCGTAVETRVAIAQLLGQGCPGSLNAVAHRLRVSTRTLQRRLISEGTGFQQQLASVRRSLAQRFLSATDLDPVAIALLLGFAEPNSFARAFRKWERTTPARWRQRHLAASRSTSR